MIEPQAARNAEEAAAIYRHNMGAGEKAMSETKFTPGPWSWSDCGSSIFVGVGSQDRICEIEARPLAGNHAHRAKANSALIASAPDLYAALESLANEVGKLRAVPPDGLLVACLCEARAALKRAMGEQ